eukprot:4351224-Lingulodinium_polyedra.AAC.1
MAQKAPPPQLPAIALPLSAVPARRPPGTCQYPAQAPAARHGPTHAEHPEGHSAGSAASTASDGPRDGTLYLSDLFPSGSQRVAPPW